MVNFPRLKSLRPKINLVTLGIILVAFIAGWQLGNRNFKVVSQNHNINFTVSNTAQPSTVNLDFKLFWSVWDMLSRSYVDKSAIDPQKMYYGAIQGMVGALGDPYTVFLPPAEQKSTKEELGGSFEGVGIQLGFSKEKRLVVIAPLKGTPADAAGIKPGDLILKINNKDTLNTTLPEAVNQIRGQKGTEVALQIYHEGDKEPKEVTLKRDTILVKSVEFETKTTPSGKKVAYIKLSRFGDKTFDEWTEAVSETLASGAQGIVLDLRNNPGGYLEGAVFIGSEFLSTGDIVMQENSSGERNNYPVNRQGKLLSLPLVVLINKGSASASEIVAGAMQDTKRGKLVGDKSFGKGTIQSTKELDHNTGIHITTAKWLTPEGRWIHNIGLTPDFEIAIGDDPIKDPQLIKALELLN